MTTIEILTAYAAKSSRHADYIAGMLTGKEQVGTDYIATVLPATLERVAAEIAPKARAYRPTESREVNGYMVDGGEDN